MKQIKQIYPFPFLPPLASCHVLSLNGGWRFLCSNAGEAPPVDAAWETRAVPGDASAQAVPSAYDWEKNNVEVQETGPACHWQRGFFVPAEATGKRVFLRFEGAAYRTDVHVNGQPTGTHKGAFTAFELDITDLAVPGKESQLHVITRDDTRLNSKNTGGLIRDVSLIIRGQAYINRLHAIAAADGTLDILFQATDRGSADFSLTSPDGKTVSLGTANVIGNESHCFRFKHSEAQPWDAEHPRMYTLNAHYLPNNHDPVTAVARFGFRSIERQGVRVMVNGLPIKLRGICRTESDPLAGKALPLERLREELHLYKEANINFIRTIGHPPQAAFMDLCDEMGFYVQVDIALNGVDQPPQPPTQNDPRFLDEYLDALRETVERDLSHPCAIIRSLGSQSCWGDNFRRCFDTLLAMDSSRLTSFSYPMTTQGEERQTDIWPVQYAAWNLDLDKKYDHMLIGHTYGIDEPPGYALGCAEGFERPVLHEQIAPPPLANREEQLRDPGVRDFWGQTIHRLWPRILETSGALGCTVDGGVDQISHHSGSDKKEEGGILDAWLRPKPEYFHLMAAYCPVRLERWTRSNLLLRNNFCHTNLNEITILWKNGARKGSLRPGNVPPGGVGEVVLPEEAKEITLKDQKGRVLGTFSPIEDEATDAMLAQSQSTGTPAINRIEGCTLIQGEGFEAHFSEETGLLSLFALGDTPLLRGGPYLNCTGLCLPDWQLLNFKAEIRDDKALVTIRGSHGPVLGVTFTLAFDNQGGLDAHYHIDYFKAYSPREVKIRIGLDPGGLDELGLVFLADGALDTLQWDSAPDPLLQGAVFPPDHIGRPMGQAARFDDNPPPFGTTPSGPWSKDDRHYTLFGRYALSTKGSNDFRSSKPRLRQARLLRPDGTGILLLPDGQATLRLAAKPDSLPPLAEAVSYHGEWWERKDKSGATYGYEMLSATAGSHAIVLFTGNGIAWYGPLDMIGGITRVSLDGHFVAEVSQAYEPLEQAGFSRGHEKRYDRLLYAAQGLASGSHTLSLELTGRKDTRADYAHCVIDRFEVLGGPPAPLLVMVNQRRNYTRLAWGNYMEPPIHPSSGDSGGVALRFFRAQEEAI